MHEPLAPPTADAADSLGAHENDHGLRLALRFAKGEGRLVASPFAAAGVRVAGLTLTLPGLTFPCNVSGGVDAFRDRPSKLHSLTLQLAPEGMRTLLRHGDLVRQGLGPMVAHAQDGFVILQGTVLPEGPHPAVPFSMRLGVINGVAETPDKVAKALPQPAASAMGVVFFDLRLYGPSPFAATEVPERLRLALSPLTPHTPLAPLGASAWRVDGERLAAQQLLPHHGFCVPARQSGFCTVSLEPSGVRLEVQPEAPRVAQGPSGPGAAAAWAAHGHFAPAEQALSQGASAAAARRYYEAAFAPPTGAQPLSEEALRWARARCFALGLHDPSLFAASLPWDDASADAPLRLFAAARLSMMAKHVEAADLYDAVADAEPVAVDRALALLASARERRATNDASQRPRAIAALREATSRAPLPPYAQAWLCELLMAQNELSEALDAARAWLLIIESQDDLDLTALAEASCTAARLCLDCGNLFEEAQGHLEQLLARRPNHGPALWQLLRVQGAACHIEAAQQTLATLTLQGVALSDPDAADHFTALGDVTQEALSDRAAAGALYRRALQRVPHHPRAHLRLGQEAHESKDFDAMVAHLQALFEALQDGSVNDEGGLDDKDLSGAHLLLGSHFMAQGTRASGPRDLALGLKHLRQALRLDGSRDDVRLRLEEALRAAQDWSALAELLVSTAAQADAQGDFPKARRWQLQAARLHLGERNEPHKALKPLLALVRRSPGDEEALALLVPLLEGNKDVLTLRHVLQDAANEQSLPALRRGLWLARLWRLEAQQGADAAAQLPILEQLLRIFPQQLEAATAQVELLEAQTNLPQEALTAHDHAMAKGYIALAHASVNSQQRAAAWRKAARALSYVGAPEEALRALEKSGQEAPLDVDSWLLGAQLKHDVEGVDAARTWLARSDTDVANTARGALTCQPFAYRIYDRMAELAAFAQDTLGEIEALYSTQRTGGTSYGVCVRLLSALEKAQRHKERADCLMSWAKAGWPLEMAPSYERAAGLYESLGALDEAREAYRALGQLDAAAMQQAGTALSAMGTAHNCKSDVLEGLELQHRAALKRHDTHAAVRLSHARVLAYEAAGDAAQAIALCHELLAQEPRARLPHSYLCTAMVRSRSWASALDHGLQATLWGVGPALDAERSQETWSYTLGLALDLRPELQDELQAACPHKGLAVPYSERLVGLGDAATAEHLLLHMLQAQDSGYRLTAVRLRLAALYTGPLNNVDRALELLRHNLADDSSDVASRRALLPVYRARGDTAQEAELHLALSNVVSDVQEALQHTLSSAELYAQDPTQRATAEQIVMAFARRSDVPKVCPVLWHGLRRMGMLLELRHVLVTGLEDQPSADDGRLAVLVRLCAQDLKETEVAISWCERMQQAFPQADEPWHLHIEMLLAGEGAHTPEQLLEAQGLYHAWAQLRQGEAQACILDALAQHLRGAGEATAALRALEAALNVSDAGPERARERLMVLCDRYLARADLPRAEQTLLRLLEVLPQGEQFDSQARRLAELCEDHMDAPDRALCALRRLGERTADDLRALTRLSVALQEAEVLAEVPQICFEVPLPTLWAMGQKLVAQGSLGSARTVLHALLTRLLPMASEPEPAAAQQDASPTIGGVWALVSDVWPEHGAARTLCAWRLAYAEEAPAPWKMRQRLLALTALHSEAADGQDKLLTCDDERRLSDALKRSFTEEVLGQAAAADADAQDLAAAFVLATALRITHQQLRIAECWLKVLPQGDSRRADPLLVCCEAALVAEDKQGALHFAQELEALGDATGEAMMLRALAAQDDRGPYLTRLTARVQVVHGEPKAQHLLALAEEQLRQHQAEAAEASLEKVALLQRDFAWGALAALVYQQLGAHTQQAEAAALAAHLAPNREERAHHLREEASVRWWEMGEVEAAHVLLHKAQALQPLRYQDLDRTLTGGDVQAAKQRLHEALVVMPQALAATLWRRLAALLPHGAQRDEALHEALTQALEDAHELGLLAEAARAAGSHDVLQGALLRLAELAVGQDPRRAARLWLEAAHGLCEQAAGPLWVRAATALFSVGAQEEAAALVHRALGAGVHDLALSTLVWRHLQEPASHRKNAARVLARHNDSSPEGQAVVVDNPLALHIAACDAALSDAAFDEAAGYAAWALSHNVDAAGVAIDAAVAHETLMLYELALEATGNAPGLVSVWRRGCRMLMPAHPWVLSRRRRAAFFAVSIIPEQESLALWGDLLSAEPDHFEAQVQHWGLTARAAQSPVLLHRMDQDLAPLTFGPHRTALTLGAANVLGRRFAGTEAAITLLGAQLRLAMTAWQQEQSRGHGNERSPTWRQVAALGDALAERLGAAGSAGDKLAVLAHCARVAPPADGLPRLAQAGLLAQAAGQHDLAYTLLYPVAVAAPHAGVTAEQTDAAQKLCCERAQERRDAQTVVDLLTRMAQRAAPKVASEFFAQAATWAEEGQLGQDQALRLLQASYALRPEPQVACRLMAGLMARGDVAALIAAHFIFINAHLDDSDTERLGLGLITALSAPRHRAAEREAAVQKLWVVIDERLPALPAALGFRLSRVRGSGEPLLVLEALENYLAGELHPLAAASQSASREALHAEAAQVAESLAQSSRAWPHWQQALSVAKPPVLLMWQAWEAQHKDAAIAHGNAQEAKRWLLQRVAQEVSYLREAATLRTASHDTRVVSLRLLSELAQDEGDLTALTWAQEQLWQRLKDSGTKPDRRLAKQVSERLSDVLSERGAWPALAQHLREAALRAPAGYDRGTLLWREGDVCRQRLHAWRAAKDAYEAALEQLPEPLALRMAAAHMALKVGEPKQALAHVALGPKDHAAACESDHLELILQAMVAADDLHGCDAVVAELTHRHPGNLFALHAHAVHNSRLAEDGNSQALAGAEAAWASLAAALGAKNAAAASNMCQRGDALEQVARYAQAQNAHDRACQALRAAIQCDPDRAMRARRMELLTRACLAAEHFDEAALLCEARAEAATEASTALACWLDAAEIWQTHCSRQDASLRALWQATAVAPERADIWLRIMDCMPEDAADLAAERLAVAEKLLLLRPKELHEPARLSALGQALAQHDAPRALGLFRQAEAAGGVTFAARSTWEDVAWQCDDMDTFVPLAKAFEAAHSATSVGSVSPKDRAKQLTRRVRLAEALLLRGKGSHKEGIRYLRAALTLLPHPSTAQDVPAMRQVASICATEPQYADIALKLYAIVLQHTPLDVEALRIAARLAGQQNAVDRAYGLYACLLWLFPMDQEARAFVEACRAQEGAGISAKSGPWVKRVQQALDELISQGAEDSTLSSAKTFDVAQLLRRDIEVVLSNMLPLPEAQVARGRALTGSPEAMALFRLAQSPHYVQLRHKLGANLAGAQD